MVRFLVWYLAEMLCSHFPTCGGCSTQHKPYEEQLQEKETAVRDLFGPLTKPILGCKSFFRYRNKMEFSFSQNKAGDRFLGLVMPRSRGKVVSLQECLISPPWFTEALRRVRAWWDDTSLTAYHFHKGSGSLRTLTVREGRRTGDRMVMLTVSGRAEFALKKEQLESFKALFPEENTAIFLRIQQITPGSATQFFEMQLQGSPWMREELSLFGKRHTLYLSPTAFAQTNTEQSEILYEAALSFLDLGKDEVVLDLYAGCATIGMIVAPFVKRVISVEINPYAVFDGKKNVEENQIDNLEIQCADVGKILSDLPRGSSVIVDPPRAGLGAEAVRHLLALFPKQILYISCNPKSQKEDISQMAGYEVVAVQPVDLFPHTPHIENIVLLRPLGGHH